MFIVVSKHRSTKHKTKNFVLAIELTKKLSKLLFDLEKNH